MTVAEAPEARRTLLETWADNERMRHIPVLEWILHRVDSDARRRIDILYPAFAALPTDHPSWAPLEAKYRALIKALDRLADVAKPGRGNHHNQNHHNHGHSHGPGQGDLRTRITSSLEHAAANLRSNDPNLFGRRYPFQTFERSKGEPLYGALLVVMQDLEQILELTRAIDRDVDERMLAGLVTLAQPLPEGPMIR